MKIRPWIYSIVILSLCGSPVQHALAEAPLSPQTNASAEFVGKLKAAVLAAKRYPHTEPAGMQGTPTVSFDYLNGVVSNIKVEKSSGTLVFDLAAKDAIKRAVYPSTPPELLKERLHVIVPVPFILSDR